MLDIDYGSKKPAKNSGEIWEVCSRTPRESGHQHLQNTVADLTVAHVTSINTFPAALEFSDISV